MDEQGNYYVAVPQLEELKLIDADSVRQRHGARKVKSLLSKDSKANPFATKLKTEFNSKPVNCITLDQFSVFIVQSAKEGNERAQSFALDLVGLSLHQLFSDAFGVKFDEEDRQKWLQHRQVHKKGFHPKYTSWLKFDGITEPRDYAKEVNRLKLCADLPLKPVDEYDADELWRLNEVESNYNMVRKLGHSHAESLRYL